MLLLFNSDNESSRTSFDNIESEAVSIGDMLNVVPVFEFTFTQKTKGNNFDFIL